MNDILLDSIIFGLQRFGGISNFWMRLIEAAKADCPAGRTQILMPRIVRAQGLPDISQMPVHAERLSPQLSRYLPARIPPRTDIFHSSYYRRPNRMVGGYVTSVYDFTYERYFSGLPRVVHHFQKRASIAAADMSVCISESTRADLLHYFPKVDPARTSVVPLGVDTTRFYPDPGSHAGAPFVLFVGQRSGYKRFDLAVEAVAHTTDLHLGIVGPPLDDGDRRQLEHRLPGRWIEHAGVGGDMLRRLYSAAHAFVFPSDYEGFGLPILEAMACGCPTIAADRSSFPEVAGDAALLASEQTPDCYAALLAMLEDTERRAQLIERGMARASLFTWKNTFARLWDCYR